MHILLKSKNSNPPPLCLSNQHPSSNIRESQLNAPAQRWEANWKLTFLPKKYEHMVDLPTFGRY